MNRSDTHKKLSNDKVVLFNLTGSNSDALHNIYTHPALSINFIDNPFLKNKSPIEVTKQIISVCEYIFTIRPIENPELIIGDCALHHWNRRSGEIFIGGSLLPDHWGKGYMPAAFQLLIKLAKEELEVTTLLAQTSSRNAKALRFAEKMGFIKDQINQDEVILRKKI